MNKSIIVLAALALLAGCSVAPKDAPQAAYEATTGFATALKGANAYAALPRCTATVAPPCSSQAVIVQMASAADKADIAVKALQTIAADTKAQASDVQKAESAATVAVAALVQIIPAH